MSETSKPALFQSSDSSTSSLRPRQTRLISFLEEEEESSKAEYLRGQRGVARHANSTASASSLERSDSIILNGQAGQSAHARTALKVKQQPNTGLWHSWQSISGIASTLLGSDKQSQARDKDGRASKAPSRPKPSSTFTTRTAISAWGMPIENTPHTTVSAVEERQAMVQAKRREVLLLADAHNRADLTSRFKRRDSDTEPSGIASAIDLEQDALVYVHKIQPNDTLAGVMIKYNCQPEAFRKINRLWPNDNIQIRKHVFVPVDACTARGKKVENVGAHLDLLNSQPEDLSLKQEASPDSNSAGDPVQPSSVASPTMHPISLTASPDAANYQHESWVRLPHFSLPTEIIRIPRRTLGYFPPARRKSGPTSPQHSTLSTPKSSLDMLRHPPTHAASLNASPIRRPCLQPTRQRSSSTTIKAPSFVDHLKGPGGVGTLRGLRMEAARPGPSEDPLNRKFREYLPNLNLGPPENFPRAGLIRSTPRASSDSIRSTSSTGLGEVGGAIEGWVRKLGGARAPRGTIGERMGDLIELDTHSDSGMGEGDEDNEQTPTMDVKGSSATEEALLNERFPVRGRVRNAYVGKDK